MDKTKMPRCSCVINAAEKLDQCEKALELRKRIKERCRMDAYEADKLDKNILVLINEILETNKYNTPCHTVS